MWMRCGHGVNMCGCYGLPLYDLGVRIGLL